MLKYSDKKYYTSVIFIILFLFFFCYQVSYLIRNTQHVGMLSSFYILFLKQFKKNTRSTGALTIIIIIIIRMTTAAIPILYVCQGIAVNEIRAGNLSANFTTVKKKPQLSLTIKENTRVMVPTAAHYFGPEKSEIVLTIIYIILFGRKKNKIRFGINYQFFFLYNNSNISPTYQRLIIIIKPEYKHHCT